MECNKLKKGDTPESESEKLFGHRKCITELQKRKVGNLMKNGNKKESTGYPSIDKPWLKYYSENAVNADIPNISMAAFMKGRNQNHLSNPAMNYYGNIITFKELFEKLNGLQMLSEVWELNKNNTP